MMELIVVIVLLGILAATALPRFINIAPEARVAALENLKGSLISGANLANAQCRFSEGCFTSGWATATIRSPDGTSGRMYNGYPTSNATAYASHITKWVEVSGFLIDTNSTLFTDFISEGASQPNDCKLRYNYAQTFGQAPSIVLSTSGC